MMKTIVGLLLLLAYGVHANPRMEQFLSEHIPLNENGKIAIASHIKHIKLDVGLSYSAPMSQQWLSNENDLIVFGFEPNPTSVASILKGAVKQLPSHGNPLDLKYVGKQFFLIPCALTASTDKNTTAKFYITDDCGCSSLYAPKQFGIEKVIDVPLFTLAEFFDLFPFDTHPIIDYIKIDAQGSDLDIIKGAGNYLSRHVVYVTIEAENTQYANTDNSESAIDVYMNKIGFSRYRSNHASDPTYINRRFQDLAKKQNIKIFQRG